MRTEDLLLRLVMLGLPLSLGCGSSLGTPEPSGCPRRYTFDQVLAVSRPTQDPPDGGRGATIEDWNSCAQIGQCVPLCEQIAPTGFSPHTFTACSIVSDPGATGGTAADADSNEPTIDVHVAYSFVDCTGRRPAGFSSCRGCAQGTKVGRWFADASVLEAASVPAFRQLAAELEVHRAPTELVRAARRAARDEVRHHRLTAAVARANGAVPRPSRIRSTPVRTLLATAVENAREGCVRETFGAATAAFQAQHAAHGRLRAVITKIARDEARHALLAWQIDAWARKVLPSEARRLTAERQAAARALARQITNTASPDASLSRALGLPSAPELQRLAAQAQDLLWNAVV